MFSPFTTPPPPQHTDSLRSLNLVFKHEENLRGGGKTIHIVYNTFPLIITIEADPGYFISRRRDHYSPPQLLPSCFQGWK
jgi:hypothetical protein